MIRAALVSILLLLLSACSRTEQVETLTGFAQGTTWHVTVWQPGGVDLNTLQKHIDAEFSRLDTVLSNYRADSDIERFNRSETTALVEVGEEIVTLVRTARTISEASQGCYDLTIKPLFDLWGFTGDTLTPPSPDVLAQVRQHIGFSKLSSPSGNLLQKSDPKLRVDLSSIAQGYSVSRIAAVVEAAGIQNYLVEIGGELQTRGHKPDGSPWRIGVERPLPEGRSVEKALTIGRDTPTAVMTSGTYRHYFDEQGQRYSHILDARTGRPVAHNTVSVTVVHDNPTEADAWSTALLCLGSRNGVKVAKQQGIAALFIDTEGGQLQEVPTTAWRALKEQHIEVN
ncbi:MAG TPA: FAD:protein FMN transferase [Marinobacter hydrocarbonoclasticus]|uniref:FAD:protein FMN transferase n=1 Tax=Marinobacter TaxID=2742 RepID=UPI000C95CB25|nr:FAD:protein FMN transferase [Marinobacter sp.]MAC21354.1 thiamine biosynthesis protein ApbE [Marinobacter sp.]HCL38312.1 FAD:protein FMN transferase [Marinobacter nauticus]HCR47003.1 FAD:protein FMN transferase [Marinobacter nauticus]|tara:strand:+ start:18678 stop:19700 length:1023 start_codon:yes stop_codon:yes gene_type:complete